MGFFKKTPEEKAAKAARKAVEKAHTSALEAAVLGGSDILTLFNKESERSQDETLSSDERGLGHRGMGFLRGLCAFGRYSHIKLPR
jgi:hypothetical protein